MNIVPPIARSLMISSMSLQQVPLGDTVSIRIYVIHIFIDPSITCLSVCCLFVRLLLPCLYLLGSDRCNIKHRMASIVQFHSYRSFLAPFIINFHSYSEVYRALFSASILIRLTNELLHAPKKFGNFYE